MELITILVVLFVGFAPFFIVVPMCKARNRSPLKGCVVVFFAGWIGLLFLWLGLKTRDANTGMLR